MVKQTRSQIGKASRAAGKAFESRVRKDLEAQGWIVDKWTNNVELPTLEEAQGIHAGRGKWLIRYDAVPGKLVPAKHKYNPFRGALALGTGFPDFVCFRIFTLDTYELIAVESKMRGNLDKEEKLKCIWLLKNKIFSKILIAKKGTKRGEIIYDEFKIPCDDVKTVTLS